MSEVGDCGEEAVISSACVSCDPASPRVEPARATSVSDPPDNGVCDSVDPSVSSAVHHSPSSCSSSSMSGCPEQQSDSDSSTDCSQMSDISGLNWKCTAGSICWVQRQISEGVDPRDVLRSIRPSIGTIPPHLDHITLWKVIIEILSEPPRRERLRHIGRMQDVLRLLRSSRRIIVLTGAGVSVSCGIPDFRSRDGIYARLAVDFPHLPDPQAMFDIDYFRRDPRPFFKFAKEIYPGQFRPSLCHRFISMLEKQGRLLRNYTQNIDTLEQEAGITRVIHCHGSFATASCQRCKRSVSAEEIREDIFQQRIPYCTSCCCSNSVHRPSTCASSSASPGAATDLNHVDVEEQEDVMLKSKESGSRKEARSQSSTSSLKNTSTSATTSTSHHHCSSIDNSLTTNNINNSDDVTQSTDYKKKTNSDDVTQSTDFKKKTNDDDVIYHRDVTSDDDSGVIPAAIMKPDIVFFGEGLSEQFHESMQQDKQHCDLLIIIGSSLKVRPVALIPSSISAEVPQILINREPLHHVTCDVELMGDCDVIIDHLCHLLGGEYEQLCERRKLSEVTSVSFNNNTASVATTTTTTTTTRGCDVANDPVNENDMLALRSCWQPKISANIASLLPDDCYLFQSPCRHVFTGAEVYFDPDDQPSSTSSSSSPSSCSANLTANDDAGNVSCDHSESVRAGGSSLTHNNNIQLTISHTQLAGSNTIETRDDNEHIDNESINKKARLH